MNETQRNATRAPWLIRKCPSCELEFRDWEAQYEHARTEQHGMASSCHAVHIQTNMQCEKNSNHEGQHAYLGSRKAILW